MPQDAPDPLIIGLGHPRCGTGFTAGLLRSAGLDIGHERLRADGMVSWMAASEREQVPWGHGVGSLSPHRVFLAVRSPLAAIPSIIPEDGRARSFGWRAQVIWERRHFDICSPAFVPKNRVAVAVASYVNWFRICLEHDPEMIFRIDRPEDDELLSDFVGRKVERSDTVRRNSRPKARFKAFTPDLLAAVPDELRDALRDLARVFGYPEDAETIAAVAAGGTARAAAGRPREIQHA